MSDIAAGYGARRDLHAAEQARLGRREVWVSRLRVALFLALAVAILWGLGPGGRAGWLLALGLAVAFVAIVRHHIGVRGAVVQVRHLRDYNEAALSRLARDWSALPLRHDPVCPRDHAYGGDLDILGPGSLRQLVDTPGTPMGQATLSAWLLAPAAAPVIVERQGAVGELAPMATWRESLTASARALGDPPPDPQPFLNWAEGARRLPALWPLVWAARLVPVALWVGLILRLTGRAGDVAWFAPLVASVALFAVLIKPTRQVIQAVRTHRVAYDGYAELSERVSATPFESDGLRRLQGVLEDDRQSAAARMRRLGRLADLALPTASFWYLPLQLACQWDVHVAWLLERWQAGAGHLARGWLLALGEAEALAALAGLAHDHPGWSFPVIDPTADCLTATSLGHPCLPLPRRVDNDVEVGPPGSFLFVTGSNMSGKSTLLQAVGVNVVLALAGGPVCAQSMTLPPTQLWTAMRVRDSLTEGVSFFMAELQRLRQVVTAARAAANGQGPPCLYLLDEILQGTNTAERQIAARGVLGHLLASGAIGAVSSHDLALADTPNLHGAARAVHFREQVAVDAQGGTLTFDHQLRPGVATSSNALQLVALMGLG